MSVTLFQAKQHFENITKHVLEPKVLHSLNRAKWQVINGIPHLISDDQTIHFIEWKPGTIRGVMGFSSDANEHRHHMDRLIYSFLDGQDRNIHGGIKS